jgi:hypothetical protein
MPAFMMIAVIRVGGLNPPRQIRGCVCQSDFFPASEFTIVLHFSDTD